MGSVTRVVTQYEFQTRWQYQKQFYQQLTWRFPTVESGTIVFLDHNIEEWDIADYEMSIPINLIFTQEKFSRTLAYWVKPLFSGTSTSDGVASDNGKTFRWQGRNLEFEGEIGNHIFLSFRPPGCLRKLTVDTMEELSLSEVRQQLVASQKPIELYEGTQLGRLPKTIFGKEEKEQMTWCYFFQKAKLAEHRGKWAVIKELGKEVRQLGLKPIYEDEWKIFLEADLR
jgi:hypothetical protein